MAEVEIYADLFSRNKPLNLKALCERKERVQQLELKIEYKEIMLGGRGGKKDLLFVLILLGNHVCL